MGEEYTTLDKTTVFSPFKGQITPLESISDQAFSSKVMGEGVAVIPESNKVFSPVDGVIDSIFETKHAIGIKSDSGVDVLIHVGQDTVELKGKYFKVYVKEGESVKAGDLLMKFNATKIIKAGYVITTPVTIVNSQDYSSVVPSKSGNIKVGEPLITITK